MIYFDLILVAAITIYIVDLSGFTNSWRAALQRALHIREMKNIKPFDCSLCMTWWVCLIYSLCVGQFTLGTIAFAALLSFLSMPIGNTLRLAREWVMWSINKLMP